MAEAETIKARADALAENQDAVIGQQLADKWPEIVEAAAKPFGDIDQMIVLNGAQGLSEALAQAMSQGVAGLQLARNLLGKGQERARHGGDKPGRPRRGPVRQQLPRRSRDGRRGPSPAIVTELRDVDGSRRMVDGSVTSSLRAWRLSRSSR